MLVLTLKQGNKIEIGGNLIIEMLGIQDGKIHLKIISSPRYIQKKVICYFNEEIQINKDVKIEATLVNGKIRLGITAPRNMDIVRLPKGTVENKQ